MPIYRVIEIVLISYKKITSGKGLSSVADRKQSNMATTERLQEESLVSGLGTMGSNDGTSDRT
jgi:hypothetical protein